MTRVFISACEPSGDKIGAKLIEQLIEIGITDIVFLGGEKMSKTLQAKSICDIAPLSVMGFLDVLPNLFVMKDILEFVTESIFEVPPDIIITIDSFGFHKRLSQKLQGLRSNTKFIHYVSPQIWAHKPKRKYEVAKLYDHLLCIMPFEIALYKPLQNRTFAVSYVGHPAFTEKLAKPNEADLALLGINSVKEKIVLMPGSRVNEIARLLPIFKKVANILIKQKKQVIVLTLPQHQKWLKAEFEHGVIVSTNRSVLQVVSAAIIKSGTTSQELVGLNIPHVVCFKTNWLTFVLAKLFLNTKFITIANIIANDSIVPELIQNFRAQDVILALKQVLLEKSKQIDVFQKIKADFENDDSKKSAIDIIKSYI